ncbi:hypothetical protein AAFF_G00345240 [Aldrovandia affinis]|uniref:Uncharacterized protein n=1 Tax=Aldrovandia affinis TaxID=143900 RepID=A0AAD7R628_9TELE|nr:hypothetical protein AAFF_G00345240 [Aldrovandia affinis]
MREIAKLRSDEVGSGKLTRLTSRLVICKNNCVIAESTCHSWRSAAVRRFPVAAIRQTFSCLTTSGRQSESDDEVLCATANKTPSAVLAPAGRGGARVKRGHRYIEDEDPSDSDSDSSPVPPPRIRERSPNRTRSSKSARIAVLKTMTAANGDKTTVSRPLTCDECTSHKNIVGELPRKGPFEPYWNRLMLQTAAFKLEHRDVWQIVLITLPSELMHRATAPLLSGTIVDPVGGETDAEVYERLKQTLLELRGPPRTAWDKIMQTKQARDEPFEKYAERLWITFKEYLGVTDDDRDTDLFLQLLKNNAGDHVQQALNHGASPSANTFDAVVRWFSSMETRLKLNQGRAEEDAHPVAAAQWLTEGGVAPQPTVVTDNREVSEDFTMGQLSILGRVPLDTDISPWWEDTFYTESTQTLTDTMELVQRNRAQVEVDLAKQTTGILTSASTRSAQYAYTWWDWVYRGCVIASLLVFTITLVQCCYFKHLIANGFEHFCDQGANG